MKTYKVKKAQREYACLGCKNQIKKGSPALKFYIHWQGMNYRGICHNNECVKLYEKEKAEKQGIAEETKA